MISQKNLSQEETSMKNRITSILITAESLISLIAIKTVMHPCSGMMKMKCSTTTDIATVLFALTLIAGIASLILRGRNTERTAAVVSGVLGLALVFVPLLGSCGSEAMRCNAYTMPAIRIGGIILLVTAAVSEAVRYKKEVKLNEN